MRSGTSASTRSTTSRMAGELSPRSSTRLYAHAVRTNTLSVSTLGSADGDGCGSSHGLRVLATLPNAPTAIAIGTDSAVSGPAPAMRAAVDEPEISGSQKAFSVSLATIHWVANRNAS